MEQFICQLGALNTKHYRSAGVEVRSRNKETAQVKNQVPNLEQFDDDDDNDDDDIRMTVTAMNSTLKRIRELIRQDCEGK
jgi:hypothetical protein